MQSLPIDRIASYVRRGNLTVDELNEIFRCQPARSAPDYSDPHPESPIPYAHRLAGAADHAANITIDASDTGAATSHNRVITIDVAENNVALHSQVITMRPDGRLVSIVLTCPVVNISVEYVNNILASFIVFARDKYMCITFAAGIVDRVVVLRQHRDGRIAGIGRSATSSAEHLLCADHIDTFTPTIYVMRNSAPAA